MFFTKWLSILLSPTVGKINTLPTEKKGQFNLIYFLFTLIGYWDFHISGQDEQTYKELQSSRNLIAVFYLEKICHLIDQLSKIVTAYRLF